MTTQTKATHTPGPWLINKHATPAYSPQYGIYAKDSHDFCFVKGSAADASLIAAAPDLLAACENLILSIKKHPDWRMYYALVVPDGEAAIRKAEGKD